MCIRDSLFHLTPPEGFGSSEETLGLASPARIERAHSYRARSASKEACPNVPSSAHSFQHLPIRLFNPPQILPKPILIHRFLRSCSTPPGSPARWHHPPSIPTASPSCLRLYCGPRLRPARSSLSS